MITLDHYNVKFSPPLTAMSFCYVRFSLYRKFIVTDIHILTVAYNYVPQGQFTVVREPFTDAQIVLQVFASRTQTSVRSISVITGCTTGTGRIVVTFVYI